ncbi:MAG: MBL fold metallo-hydrolase [Oscillospiraceae bacterium]|nr:MBL fold metallo-hydrolase [Oscillospiraceae bacterium]
MSLAFPLFSGSTGNSNFLQCKNTAILVDIGCSAKQLEISLIRRNLDPSKINSIFITHEHLDHVRGLRVFASRYKIPVYSSKGTIKFLKKRKILSDEFSFKVIPKEGVGIGDLFIKTFNLSHDCQEGVGYVIETQTGKKAAFVTDTGCITEEIRSAVRGCDLLFLESNHDVNMVACGSYPYHIKRRIISDIGHLSNEDCAKELPELVKLGLRHIVLSHLSENNNLTQLAYQTCISTLLEKNMKENRDYILSVAKKSNNSCNGISF